MDDKLGSTGLADSFPGLRSLYEYFASNFIGVRNHGFQPPRYEPMEWNLFDRVRLNLPRSDSSLEGWHYAIQGLFGIHPTFYVFMERLRTEIEWSMQTMTLYESGDQVRRQRQIRYEQLDQRLSRLVSMWENDGGYYGDRLLQYLMTVSKLFRMDSVTDENVEN